MSCLAGLYLGTIFYMPSCLSSDPQSPPPHTYNCLQPYSVLDNNGIMVSMEDSAPPGGRQKTCSSEHIHFSGMKLTVISPLSLLPFDKKKGFELILSFCPGSRKELIEAPLCGTTCPCVQNHVTTRILEDDWDLGWFSELQKVGWEADRRFSWNTGSHLIPSICSLE